MIETENRPIFQICISNITAYCHLFCRMDKSHCGIPREEQETHGGWGPGKPIKRPNFCPDCGLRPCAKCAAACPDL